MDKKALQKLGIKIGHYTDKKILRELQHLSQRKVQKSE